METNEDYMNEDFISSEDSLMYIDEGSEDLEICQQESISTTTCRKKCVVRLDNARYTIGKNLYFLLHTLLIIFNKTSFLFVLGNLI